MKRNPLQILTVLFAFALLVLTPAALAQPTESSGPFQATGIKIGEVTHTSAIVWTRLTRLPGRVSPAPEPEVFYRLPITGRLAQNVVDRPDWTPVVRYPKGSTIDTIEGAVPGATGEVRVLYKPETAEDWTATDWAAVDPGRDFTRQFLLSGLQPSTRYSVRVESRAAENRRPGQTLDGSFGTAPAPNLARRISFAVSTGQEYHDQDSPGGFKIYPVMQKLGLDFFVHTGDIVYYDALAKTIALARWHWDRMYSLPTNFEFHRFVPTYFIKDDHDTWMNDCYPTMKTKYMGDFTFAQGQQVFLDEVPMGDRTYRTVRWGKDLQIWLVEGRDFRSPNNMPDGPGKTIWGSEQKAWFKRTVDESDAAFRVLISPTPLVGPDRGTKNDNHANQGFTHEGDELRAFLASRKNMIVICGDRHWQYVSVDGKTGLREYSCGPASNQHAGGWSNDRRLPEHRYLNVVGGFLTVTVDRVDGDPVMVMRHYSVDGAILHEEKLSPDKWLQ